MDKDYVKTVSIAKEFLSKINRIYDNAKTGTFEDNKGCKAMEEFISNIEDFINTVEHYSKDTKEGYLELNCNGRYELKGIELTCGYPVEIYNVKYNEWNDGRIEHSDEYGDYYFYNYDDKHMSLSDEFKARIRYSR